MTPTCLDISSKKRYLWRHFKYFKAHNISNKLVSKVSAHKKGGEVMTATNIYSNFGGMWIVPPKQNVECISMGMEEVHELITVSIGLGQCLD